MTNVTPFPAPDPAAGGPRRAPDDPVPQDLDRLFGRGRLRMLTGRHVEVFREEARPGERRRYTKRFLATDAGDFRAWTEREWRILARLVGHGIACVPEVARFDRGGPHEPAIVQTYDAGITVDHWATLLPVQRDGRPWRHVFEDCAHWWALARHLLLALDAVHELRLVHLDLKPDNVCIPPSPADFDPAAPARLLRPRFEQLALIDFAFSLVCGDPLATALPLARQPDYDYQSPRLLAALQAARAGDLRPTRELDWRCDFYSMAALLSRYLPDPHTPAEAGWTPARQGRAQALLSRLQAIHDGGLPARRPHADLADDAAALLRDPALAASLARGWVPDGRRDPTELRSPTPVTRIALPLAPTPAATGAPPHRPPPAARRRWPALGAAAAALVLAVPLLAEGWKTLAGDDDAAAPAPLAAALPAAPAAPVSDRPIPDRMDDRADDHADARAGSRTGSRTIDTVDDRPESRADGQAAASATKAPPAPSASGPASVTPAPPAEPASGPAAAPGLPAAAMATRPPPTAPAIAATAPPATSPAPSPRRASPPTPTAAHQDTPAGSRQAQAQAERRPRPTPRTRHADEPASTMATRKATATATATATTTTTATTTATTARAAASTRPGTPPPAQKVAAAGRRPWLEPRADARAATRPAASGRATAPTATAAPATRPPPTLPPPLLEQAVLRPLPPAPAAPAPMPAAAPASPPRSAPPATPSPAVETPRDLQARADTLLAAELPRIAERAERLVLRVLFAAGRGDGTHADDEVRQAATALRLAPAEALPVPSPSEARALDEAAQQAQRRGDLPAAIALMTRAFAANPLDADVAGDLAALRLRSSSTQAAAARQLALHALTTPHARHPQGRLDDWTTLAIANALTGRERDARHAWYVTLTLSPDADRLCRIALHAYVRHGERLRPSIDALLQRAEASGRAAHAPSCDWPPRWAGTGR